MSGTFVDVGGIDSDPTQLIARLLQEQKELSAVERFAERHESGAVPTRARYYSDLIPLTLPGPFEQYAFRVDLDACSGCKACVAACHELNGLEDDETWREVGLLVSTEPDLPILQHVTASCHHCIDPGCLSGCPAAAYHKDSVTGIVRHLDDQCIGCQYCVWTCPYEAPKYNSKKGIVRKCDMCQQRLAVGDAPACVQSCPSQAISIEIVSSEEIARAAASNDFLSAAPDPRITMPTTRYVSRRRRRRRTGILDSLRDEPSAPHWPLIWMLLLSQLSLGVLLFERILTIAFTMVTERAGFIPVQRSLALCASASAIAAVLVGPLHLGRPWLAFRSILGWRTSWLSREVIGLGAFAAASTAHVVLLFNRLDWGLPRWVTHLSGFIALAMGCIAVACSAMVYVATHRDAWSGRRVFREFGFSTLALGVTSALFALGIARLFSVPFRGSPAGVVSICVLLHVAAILNSGRMFKHRALLQMASNEQSGAATGIESRIARLLSGPLLKVTQWRGRLGFLSGLLIPLLVASQPPYAQASLSLGHILFQLFLLSSTVILQSGSELLNKYSFFVTAVTKRMPRGMP